MAKMLQNGRSKYQRHVRLDHSVFYGAAYRALGCNARALLWELIGRFNGVNNGHIYLGVRDAMCLTGLASDSSVTAAFRELTDHGLIERVTAGSFTLKVRHAAVWRLTFLPANRSLPTQEYNHWKAPAKSKSAKRLLALIDCRLRSDFPRLSDSISRADSAIGAPPVFRTVPKNGTAILQLPHDSVLQIVPDSGAHILRHRTVSRRASRDACIAVRKQALAWLGESPDRTQKALTQQTGIGASKLSRFLHDPKERATLREDQLKVLHSATRALRRVRSTG